MVNGIEVCRQKEEVACLDNPPLSIGAKGTRTLYLLIANQSLYQMSYGPNFLR